MLDVYRPSQDLLTNLKGPSTQSPPWQKVHKVAKQHPITTARAVTGQRKS